MRIERHVFGSYKGYTTLAKSAGISLDDARHLEGGVYGFGQTEDPDYAKSLRTRPAFFTRLLSNNRRGLTRVFEGRADSDGRPTNLMITAVLPCSDWDEKLLGDVGLLLADKQIWHWPGGDIAAVDRQYPPSSFTIPRQSALKIASLVSEIERRWNAGVPIIVAEGEFGSHAIRAVEILIPPNNRGQFTSACRSLGPQLAVTLNQLAAEAPLQKANFHFDAQSPASPYTEFLLDNGLADGELPVAELRAYRIFGRAEPERSAKRRYVPPPMPAEKSSRGWMLWLAGALLVLVAFAGAYVGKRRTSARPLAIHLSPPITAIRERAPELPTPSEIRTARTAMDSTSPQIAPVPVPVAPPGPAPITKPEPMLPAPASVSAQDKALEKLQGHWSAYLDRINRETLTFVGAQGQDLDDLEKEMHAHGLVKRIEMGATGNIAALPMLLAVRDQYFQVNSLLSDPHAKNSKGLADAMQQLEAATWQAKLILSPIASEPSSNGRIFFKVDRTLRKGRERLKEMRAEVSP